MATMLPARRKKEPRISVRIPKGSDLAPRLMRALEITGLGEPTPVLHCAEAAVAYVERHGLITLPLQLIPNGETPTKLISAGKLTQNNIAYSDSPVIPALRAAEHPSKMEK